MTKKPKNTLTGSALGEILSQRGLTQYGVAKSANVPQPYVNLVANGRRTPSPQWLDIIADAAEMTPEERQRLHRAAAKDRGFKIDLTK